MPMDKTNRMQRGSLVGAIVGSIAASLCCLGPLVVGLLGVGGAGALARFAPYRPYILAATSVLLAAGFWLTYRKRGATGDADACGCERPRTARTGRVMLWIATVMVTGFAASPYIIAWAGRGSARTHGLESTTSLQLVVLHVDGMDCESCAIPIRRAVESAGARQVDVDLANARVVVQYATGATPERYVQAIDRLGYPARVERGPCSATRGPQC